jgi:hypothetical protein
MTVLVISPHAGCCAAAAPSLAAGTLAAGTLGAANLATGTRGCLPLLFWSIGNVFLTCNILGFVGAGVVYCLSSGPFWSGGCRQSSAAETRRSEASRMVGGARTQAAAVNAKDR